MKPKDSKEEPVKRLQVVTTFGRFNPPTTGHSKLISQIKTLASAKNADHRIFLSKSHDKDKNPLTHRDKLKFLSEMHPGTVFHDETNVNNPLEAMKHLQKLGYTKVTFMTGSDRQKEFSNLLHKYNGKEYKFENINVVSAGDRDPDAEGVKGMSGTKMREAAMKGDFKSFVKGVPNKKKAKELYSAVRKGMKTESYNALFLLGGPGSGKDFVLRNTVLGSKRLVEINLDKLSKAIVEHKDIEEINAGASIIINGNADDVYKVLTVKMVLEYMGYRTSAVYVYTSNDVSKVRNERRIRTGSKTLTEDVRTKKYNASVAGMCKFSEVFEDFIIYDNSGDAGQVNEERQAWIDEINEYFHGFFSGSPEIDEQVAEFLNEKENEYTANRALATTPKKTPANDYFSHNEKNTFKKFKGTKAAKPPVSLNDSRASDGMSGTTTLSAS